MLGGSGLQAVMEMNAHQPPSSMFALFEVSKMKYINLNVAGVYSLSCPETGEVRYIGQSKNIAGRYSSHKRPQKVPGHPVSSWVASLAKKGLSPDIAVLHISDNRAERDRLEIKEISDRRVSGARLLNVHAGGSMPSSMGNGKTHDIWSVDGIPAPWTVLSRAMLCRSRSMPKVKAAVSEMRERYRKCKTEKDRMEFQLECFLAIQDLCDNKIVVQMEEWLIIAAPAINAKYPGRVTIAFADGVTYKP